MRPPKMEFAEIKELLDNGFKPDQIMTLATAKTEKKEDVSAEVPIAEVPIAEVPIAAPIKNDDQLFARLNTLEKTISELTKTIQANAIMHDLQPGQSVKSDMDILASVLNPAGK